MIENSSDYSYLIQNETSQQNYYVPEELLDFIIKSHNLLENTTRFNLIATFIVIIFGLIGNYLIIFVFAQKENRKNSSHVFLLCLAINDAFFLKIHFFENVLRTFQSLTFDGLTFDNSLSVLYQAIRIVNIIDRFSIACRLINYFRYVLRLVSALIVVAFTLQRLIIVTSPLNTRFKSKSCAWISVLIISCISIIINAWVPFIFEVQIDSYSKFCDIKKGWKSEYLQITCFYVALTMLIPILTILIINFMTIFKTITSDSERNNRLHVRRSCSRANTALETKYDISFKNNSLKSFIKLNNIKPFYMNNTHIETKITAKLNNSKKITRMLMFISFSYAIFNLPYLIVWLIYYYKLTMNTIDPVLKNYLFSLTRIAETLQILNYSLHFYVYCLAGEKFRKQLKTRSNFIFSLFFMK